MSNEKWLKNMIHKVCISSDLTLDQKIDKLKVFKILLKQLDK